MQKYKNEKGMTLIELLATVVVLAVLATLSYQVLFQGFSNYSRIKLETELRDDADYIMASLMREVFTYKESEIEFLSESNNYLFKLKKDPETMVTGIESGRIVIAGTPLHFTSTMIKLDESSKITSEGEGKYDVIIILTNKNKTMEFKNTIRTINNE